MALKSKKILILANEFPYGCHEQYMESEEKYYSRFDRAWIAALGINKTAAESRRDLQSKAEVIPVWYQSRHWGARSRLMMENTSLKVARQNAFCRWKHIGEIPLYERAEQEWKTIEWFARRPGSRIMGSGRWNMRRRNNIYSAYRVWSSKERPEQWNLCGILQRCICGRTVRTISIIEFTGAADHQRELRARISITTENYRYAAPLLFFSNWERAYKLLGKTWENLGKPDKTW